MSARTRPAQSVALAGTLALALATGLGASPTSAAAAGVAAPAVDPTNSPADPPAGTDGSEAGIKHSSDGFRGETAAPRPLASQGGPGHKPPRPPVDSNVTSWTVAPGVSYTQWDRKDFRGTIRAYLVRADLDTPGVGVDYLGPKHVQDRETVLDMTARERGVAGINGDFFDIYDTGAPLGFGADLDRGFLHGREVGWNRAFYLTNSGTPNIGDVYMKAKVRGHDELKVTTANAPAVEPDRVGVYTSEWGRTLGERVTDGDSAVREVVIRNNKVVRNRTRLSDGYRIRDEVLIGRGQGAKRLGWLRVGKKARVVTKARNRVTVAVTGNRQLLDEGIRTVINDVEMHPRTAIGIDRDTNQVLMLVIDGRQDFSRGYTMVELADLMLELGAEDALNLDGGGSSTMAALDPAGVLDVRNSPSDDVEGDDRAAENQRLVPDGLEITYTAPPAG